MKKNPKFFVFTPYIARKTPIAAMCALSFAALVLMFKILSCSLVSPSSVAAILVGGTNSASLIYERDVTRTILRLSLPTMSFSAKRKEAEKVEGVKAESADEEETTDIPPAPENDAQSVNYKTAEEIGYSSVEGIYINNQTSLSVDIASLLNSELSFSASSEPYVLIVHTHTSESYTQSALYNYIPSDTYRTEDINYNVAAVGGVIYEKLCGAGINVIHDTSINDYPSYNGSYAKTLKLIESYIEKYPSIKVVLDIHRDAIIKSDGTNIRTAAEVNGEECAQVMLVVGTDQTGLSHPNWSENLSFALKLQYKMNEMYPSLARPINLRKQRFNQHTAPGALIVEVGTNGNTLEEALLGASYFADALIEVLPK